MIRINLLPAYEVKERLLLRTQVTVAMMLAIVTVVGCGWVMTLQGSEKSTRLAELDRIDSEIRRLQETVDKVNKYESQLSQLNKQIEVIAGLKSSQRRPAPVLDALSQSLPEKVWISSIQEIGMGITIKGKSLNGNVGIAAFMERMESSPLFGTAELVVSTKETLENREVVSFTLTVPFQQKPKSERATS